MRRDPNAARPTAVNFLPDWYRQRRRRRQVLRWQVLLLLGLVLVFGVLIGQQVYERSELNNREARLLKRLEATRQQNGNLDALRKTHRQLVQSLRVQHRLHRPVGYAEIAATLIDLVPESVSLRRLRMEVGEQTAPAPKDEPDAEDEREEEEPTPPEQRTYPVVTIQIEGIGPSDAEVSRFTGALASNPLFGDVEIGYWRQGKHDGLHVRRFDVRTTVRLDRRYQPPAEPAEVTDAG